jgi:hypothetical protein
MLIAASRCEMHYPAVERAWRLFSRSIASSAEYSRISMTLAFVPRKLLILRFCLKLKPYGLEGIDVPLEMENLKAWREGLNVIVKTKI